jgi:Fur family ferric uptake transcriptional regulator
MKGFRMTRGRRIILQVMGEVSTPLTAEDILERVSVAVPGTALSTVYRTLDELVSRGSVERMLLRNDDRSFFELVREGHRHYMVCLACHGMFALTSCPIGDYADRTAEELDFQVTDHTLVLYGYCGRCRSKRQSQGLE